MICQWTVHYHHVQTRSSLQEFGYRFTWQIIYSIENGAVKRRFISQSPKVHQSGCRAGCVIPGSLLQPHGGFTSRSTSTNWCWSSDTDRVSLKNSLSDKKKAALYRGTTCSGAGQPGELPVHPCIRGNGTGSRSGRTGSCCCFTRQDKATEPNNRRQDC